MDNMEIIASRKTALLFGATGLVGRQLLNGLLDHKAYQKVIAPTRRKLHGEHRKLENPVVNFDKLDRYPEIFQGQDLFLALGTTLKRAGSKEAFRQVDYEYVVDIGRRALRAGANQCLLVSSAGADSESAFFYNRVKGETEEAITGLDYWAIHIFRPGVLLGERSEARLAEKISGSLTGLLRSISPGILGDYNPTNAEVLARKMIESAQTIRPGVTFHRAEELVS